MEITPPEEMEKAGTGDMMGLQDTIRELQKKGYKENFAPCYDHLTFGSGYIKVYPRDIIFDEIFRFENSSDPDDQSILYAISYPALNIKGLLVESYGLYHDELSNAMIERIKFSRALKRDHHEDII